MENKNMFCGAKLDNSRVVFVGGHIDHHELCEFHNILLTYLSESNDEIVFVFSGCYFENDVARCLINTILDCPCKTVAVLMDELDYIAPIAAFVVADERKCYSNGMFYLHTSYVNLTKDRMTTKEIRNHIKIFEEDDDYFHRLILKQSQREMAKRKKESTSYKLTKYFQDNNLVRFGANEAMELGIVTEILEKNKD